MPADAAVVSRRLLGRIRDVMAGQGSAEGRLRTIVTTIAQELKVAVCSCYVMRAGEVLELFATYGLRESAVHITRLRVGEGLVGFIAAHPRTLALADAWSHPNFAYRPETGENPIGPSWGCRSSAAGGGGGAGGPDHRTRDFVPESRKPWKPWRWSWPSF